MSDRAGWDFDNLEPQRDGALAKVLPINLRRCDLPPHHWMLTLGWESCGIRVTMGTLDHNGKWHKHWPDVFLLWGDRRIW